MTVLDEANAFIGHAEEVDEGYETTMRRNAFVAGWEAGFTKACEITHDFAELVSKMMAAQSEEVILDARIKLKKSGGIKVEEDDYIKHNAAILQMTEYESKVNTWIKENYPHLIED